MMAKDNLASLEVQNILLDGDLSLNTIWQVAFAPGRVKVVLGEQSRRRVQASRSYIEARLKKGDVMYGVNTGFGSFSSVVINEAQTKELQVNLIRSHSVGMGPALSIPEVRAIMLLRANTLARGHSGVRPELIDKILEFLNGGIYPFIPCQGSVGASGDLAPLAHLALALIGEGQVLVPDVELEVGFRIKNTADVLLEKSVSPLELLSKEGLALINGCQVMTAIGAVALKRAIHLAKLSDIAAAMTLEATRGSRSPYHELISKVRPHFGEKQTALNLNKILGKESDISNSHKNCGRVQDAYSLRCVPAVHGAVKASLLALAETLITEANSSTDNPLVFADEDLILSCGNFHGMPVAFKLDMAAIAVSALGNISERRIAKLIDPVFSGLPAFLSAQEGLHSGHMIVQVAAASLVSENKILCHPASSDSIPTSSDKEDHVSMGTIAARKWVKVLDHVEMILAFELLSAAQGLDFLKPLKPGPVLERVHNLIRSVVPFAKTDRAFSWDAKEILKQIQNQEIVKLVEEELGEELECL